MPWWFKNTTVDNFLTGSIPSEVEALPNYRSNFFLNNGKC